MDFLDDPAVLEAADAWARGFVPSGWADAYLDVLDHDSRAHSRDDAWTWDSPHALLVNLPLRGAREQLARQRSWWLP